MGCLLGEVEMSFWVGRNNPRFPTARGGYLPALENVSDKVSVKGGNIKVIYRFIQVPKKKRTYKHYT